MYGKNMNIEIITINILGYIHDRNLFNKFAHNHNFDPLVADNWYNFTINSFVAMKVRLTIIVI